MDEIRAAAFRTSMGGFNKKDVNNYIAALSRGFEEKAKAYESELASMSAAADEMQRQIAELEAARIQPSELDALREELTHANAMLDARSKQIDTLTAERDELKSQLSDMTAKLSLFAGMEEKLGDYERMKVKMGELYLEAASSAERIKSDAEAYANARRSAVDAELTAMRDERFAKLVKIFDGISDELCAVIESYRKKAMELDSDDSSVSGAIESFQ